METRRPIVLGFSLLIGGLASCSVGLWLVFCPAQYESDVRIIVEPDVSDIVLDQDSRSGIGSYDPYFVQTTFEIIRSPVVLSNVVEVLNLNDAWRKKHLWGNRLGTKQSIELLRKRIDVQNIRGTRYIKISVTSDDPVEAARLANAIAQSYEDYRLSVRRQMTAKGIEALEEQYREDEEKIRVLQTNVDLLRDKYHINKEEEAHFDNPTTLSLIPKPMTPAEQEELKKEYEQTRPFWEKKRELSNMLQFHKLTAVKIEAEKSQLSSISPYSMVFIAHFAQPPTSPVGRDYALGVPLFAIGLFPTVGGFLLLKSSRRQAA